MHSYVDTLDAASRGGQMYPNPKLCTECFVEQGVARENGRTLRSFALGEHVEVSEQAEGPGGMSEAPRPGAERWVRLYVAQQVGVACVEIGDKC